MKYSTVQNWYPGDKAGKGGVYNFVTKRGICHRSSKISWTQVETGSAVTWKYPSCILKGDDSIGEFFSVAVTNNMQQANTGTKMIHLGKRSDYNHFKRHLSREIPNSYRGLKSTQALLTQEIFPFVTHYLSEHMRSNNIPYIEASNPTAKIEHEATTSKIGKIRFSIANKEELTKRRQ